MPAESNYKEDLLAFLESTDLHGIPRIVKSSHPLNRTLWIIAVIICLTLMLYQTTTLLINFSNNEVTTHFEEIQTKPEFPDVTVCNISPYDAFERFPETYDDYVIKVNKLQRTYDDIRADEYMGSMPDTEWRELRSKRAYIVNNPRFEARSYSPEDTLLVDHFWYGWQFNTQPVTNETIAVNWNTEYYRCYTFTSPAIPDILGFSAIFYLANSPPKAMEFYKFYVGMAMTPGIRLVIHPRGTQPYMRDGITISPGTETSIYLTQTNITRLADPFGKCTQQSLLEPDSPLDSTLKYSRSSCQAVNRQLKSYVVQCGCLVSYEIYINSMADMPFCSNISSYDPSGNLSIHDIENILGDPMCDGNTWPPSDVWECELPCIEKKYDIQAMHANWPSVTSYLEFYQTYIKPNPRVYQNKFDIYQQILDRMDNMTSDDVLEELELVNLIRKNFLQVNIRLDETLVHGEIQKPSTTWDTMLANVGATLHFWLGITVLFVAELTEFCCYFIIKTYQSRRSIMPVIMKQSRSVGEVTVSENISLERITVTK